MIQRIQSVYLLLVAILLVVALCLPVGQFIGPDGIAAHIFKPLGVTLADGNFQSTWGLVRHSAVECDYCVMHHIPVP